MTITLIQDNSCVRGTFRSILADAECTTETTDSVLLDIARRKDPTNENNTSLFPNEVPRVLENCFAKFDCVTINNMEAIANLIPIDNKNSFGILFWNGDGKGNNHHCTRFIQMDGDQFILMEPGSGKLIVPSIKYLFEIVPLGFDFVWMCR